MQTEKRCNESHIDWYVDNVAYTLYAYTVWSTRVSTTECEYETGITVSEGEIQTRDLDWRIFVVVKWTNEYTRSGE